MIYSWSLKKDMVKPRRPSGLALTLAVAVGMWLAIALPASAYVGPGAGITMLGALWGVILAVVLVIATLIWFPVQVMRRRRRARRPDAPSISTHDTEKQ